MIVFFSRIRSYVFGLFVVCGCLGVSSHLNAMEKVPKKKLGSKELGSIDKMLIKACKKGSIEEVECILNNIFEKKKKDIDLDDIIHNKKDSIFFQLRGDGSNYNDWQAGNRKFFNEITQVIAEGGRWDVFHAFVKFLKKYFKEIYVDYGIDDYICIYFEGFLESLHAKRGEAVYDFYSQFFIMTKLSSKEESIKELKQVMQGKLYTSVPEVEIDLDPWKQEILNSFCVFAFSNKKYLSIGSHAFAYLVQTDDACNERFGTGWENHLWWRDVILKDEDEEKIYQAVHIILKYLISNDGMRDVFFSGRGFVRDVLNKLEDVDVKKIKKVLVSRDGAKILCQLKNPKEDALCRELYFLLLNKRFNLTSEEARFLLDKVEKDNKHLHDVLTDLFEIHVKGFVYNYKTLPKLRGQGVIV